MGKTYIVTGCGSGIGQRIAQKLLERGEKVCATDINANELDGLKKFASLEDQLILVYLDVRNPDQWETLIQQMEKRWGKIDVLMNIAGIWETGPVEKFTPDVINMVIDTNLKGVIFGTSIVARHMITQKSGHIINIASLAGIVAPLHHSIYSASKFGVRGFSHAAGQDLYEYGIKVTVVCPNIVNTPMSMNKKLLGQKAVAFLYGGKILEVEDVVNVMLNKVLKRAPLEIVIPKKDGILYKLLGFTPNIRVAQYVINKLNRKGLKVREEIISKMK